MNFIIEILKQFVALVDIEKKKVLAIVDRDFGLIRYLLTITKEYIFDTNKSGYVQVPNRQNRQRDVPFVQDLHGLKEQKESN